MKPVKTRISSKTLRVSSKSYYSTSWLNGLAAYQTWLLLQVLDFVLAQVDGSRTGAIGWLIEFIDCTADLFRLPPSSTLDSRTKWINGFSRRSAWRGNKEDFPATSSPPGGTLSAMNTGGGLIWILSARRWRRKWFSYQANRFGNKWLGEGPGRVDGNTSGGWHTRAHLYSSFLSAPNDKFLDGFQTRHLLSRIESKCWIRWFIELECSFNLSLWQFEWKFA